ncbi:MAG: GldG family protein, partial [Candidatus Omnitrophica bacterium]|nr:GldG family protein [Candidatus Omnitrophota bacterium]MBU1996263.1 GldG family protein [Candidatus Omnitrophota bacterium]
MMTKNNDKNLRLLISIGLICLLYSACYSYIEEKFDKFSVMLAFTGLLCVVICFLYKMNDLFCLIKSFSFKKNIIVCLVSVLFVVVYIQFNYLGVKYDRSWDLTKGKQHTLSKNTSQYIKQLKQDVSITAFYVGIPPKYLEDLLSEYEKRSDKKVSTEIIDPIVEIGYAAKFGNVISGKENKLIVQSLKERRDIDFTERPLTEEQVTNSIIRVTRSVRNVYFLVGHGEYNISNKEDNGLTIFKELLGTNNIISHKLFLGSDGKIPEDCDVLVIAGSHDFLEEKEVEEVRDYLKRGGDALLMTENVLVTTPDKPLSEEELKKNPSLNNILNDWGLNVGDDVVVDLSSHAGSDVGSPATKRYMRHEAITKELGYTFFVRPRSISVIKYRRPTIKLAPIVVTESDENSWAEKDRTLNIKFDETIDTPGPIALGFVAWEGRDEEKSTDTRLILFTDADFLTNAFIRQYSNARLGL